MRKSAIAFILCLVFARVVHSAPSNISASGTMNDGQSITLSGAGFGTPSSRDFVFLGGSSGVIETTATGVTPSNANGWIYNNGVDYSAIITDTGARSGSKALYQGSSGPNAALRFDWGSGIAPGNTVYVTWWTMVDWDSFAGATQWKMFRLSWENDIQDTGPEAVMFNWFSDSAPKQFYMRPGPTETTVNAQAMYPRYPAKGVWTRMEMVVHESSVVGAADASWTVGSYVPSGSYTSTSDTGTTYWTGEDDVHRWFLWQNYHSGFTNWRLVSDDYYVQVGSVARIELCDSHSWATRTSCDIQSATAWSDTGAIITLNTGGFSTGQTAYLYVVDSNGDANASGYEVTIGESITPTPIDGVCGSNNGATLSSLTSGDANNCSAGTVSGFTGSGPWSWTCAGINGGDDSSTCSASLTSGSVSAWLTSGGSILTSGGAVITPAQ